MIAYEENANVAPVKSNPAMIPDYYDRFKAWTEPFTGNAFKVTCAYASTVIVDKCDNSGKHFVREDLKCAFTFKHNGETYYFEDRFFGNRTFDDGTKSGNSRRLNEFLELAHRQNPDCLSDSFEYETQYSKGSVIPNLAGLQFIMAVATTGERTFNGRTYLNNRVYWFATDKRAAYEIKSNVDPADCNAFKAACIELKEDAEKYQAEDQAYAARSREEAAQQNGQQTDVAEAISIEPIKAGGNSNDDIPF